MIFTLGCLSVLFGVVAMLWADGRLAQGFLHSLFSRWSCKNATCPIKALATKLR
jgi:hypothetical protein